MYSHLSQAWHDPLKKLQEGLKVLYEGERLLQEAVQEASNQPSNQSRDHNGTLVQRMKDLSLTAGTLPFFTRSILKTSR